MQRCVVLIGVPLFKRNKLASKFVFMSPRRRNKKTWFRCESTHMMHSTTQVVCTRRSIVRPCTFLCVLLLKEELSCRVTELGNMTWLVGARIILRGPVGVAFWRESCPCEDVAARANFQSFEDLSWCYLGCRRSCCLLRLRCSRVQSLKQISPSVTIFWKGKSEQQKFPPRNTRVCAHTYGKTWAKRKTTLWRWDCELLVTVLAMRGKNVLYIIGSPCT